MLMDESWMLNIDHFDPLKGLATATSAACSGVASLFYSLGVTQNCHLELNARRLLRRSTLG